MTDAHLLHDLIAVAAARDGAAPALQVGAEALSYCELQQQVHQMASGLRALGLARGDRVGIWLEKRVETVVASFGAPAAGCVMVPMNPLLKPEQVVFILRDCDVRVLVTSPERLALLADPQWQPYVDAGVRLSKQMFTYEHGNESAAVQSMLAQSTGALRELLTKDGNVDNLTKLFRDTNASSVATVNSAGLESFDGSTAVVLVAVSVQVGAQPSTKYRQRVWVVKEDNALKVANVKYPDGGN